MMKLKLLKLVNFIVAPINIFVVPMRFESKVMRLIDRMTFSQLNQNEKRFKEQMVMHIKKWKKSVLKNQMSVSMWDTARLKKGLQLPYFRSDNIYLYQTRDINTPDSMVLTYKYVKSNDILEILKMSEERGEFGAEIVHIPTYGNVSRDLLDSVTELNFLENKIGLSGIQNLTIYDIGAGYGRLALHAIKHLNNIKEYVCLDAIAESLGLCEFYLKHNKIEPSKYKIGILPHDFIPPQNSIAVAIHSFPEMPIDSILNWLSFMQKMKTDWIYLVPNREKHSGANLLSTEKNGDRLNYSAMFAQYGFEKHGVFPKYDDLDVQKYGVSPTMYHLYRRIETEDNSEHSNRYMENYLQ